MEYPSSLARRAGTIGFVGSFLWLASVIIHHSLGLFGPESGSLWIAHQLLAFTAITCVMIGFLGLIWGGAVENLFGKASVYIYIFSWALIVLAGLVFLVVPSGDNPIFILFPVGGFLSDLGALLTGIAVISARLWKGWQRFMPMANFIIVFTLISLPSYLNNIEGPGLVGELLMGVCWFGVALAVFTSQSAAVMSQKAYQN